MAENRPLLIPDASVVIKWFLHESEEDMKQALQLAEDFRMKKVDLAVPQNCIVEFSNTIGRKSSHCALTAFSEFNMLEIAEYRLTLEIASLGFELMIRHPKISFYTAAYHALALHLNGTFVTCDRKYYEMTKKEGRIQLLKDY